MLKTIFIHFEKLVLSLLGLVFVVGGVHAIDIDTNLFVDPTDAGPVSEVQLVGTSEGQEDSLFNIVSGFINWTLGILALIALIVVLRGGFQMVIAAGNEDRYNNGFKILKQAAIGLALIGLAWFIVSLIFWVINLVATGAEGTGGSTIN